MPAVFEPPKGPPAIKALNSNKIAEEYRDSLGITYSFIGATVPEISFELGGKTFSTPIMSGPIPANREKGGDEPYAMAVKEAGAVFWYHFHDKDCHARLLKAGVPVIRVIKPLRNVDDFIEEVKFDTDNGALGYAMDLSHGMTAYGELDAQREHQFGPKTFDDLARISEASPLPFFIKDIMSVQDAILAEQAGAAGIILSNHNNRFPCSVPMLQILPQVRNSVGSNFKVFIDGSFTTGYDVFKALALGADGVLCARTFAAAFATGGAEALTTRILEMTAELKGAMGATGSPDLEHINRECIVRLG